MDKATELVRKLRWHKEARETARKAARRSAGKYIPREDRNRYLAAQALVREPLANGAEAWVTYTAGRADFLRLREQPALTSIAHQLCDPDALNGYVAFPKRAAPKLPAGTGDIAQYIPVHGGVTYATKDGYMAVWGFDTMHAGSEVEPRTDKDWILANCWVLYRGLLQAAQLWPKFRRADRFHRAEMADQLLALIEEQPLNKKLGFEAMFNTLFGKVG